MSVFIGLDLGTTKITALALSDREPAVVAVCSLPTPPRNAPAEGGYFEWDAVAIAEQAEQCLAGLVASVGSGRSEVAAVGVTGQQHGVVVVDDTLRPLTPFINWQDRRGDEYCPGSGRTYVEEAHARLGPDAVRRAGCTLATGHLGLTLFWLREHGMLPVGTACSIMEFVTSRLSGRHPVSEPTCAAGSALFDAAARTWDRIAIQALGLPEQHFPEIQEAGKQIGRLQAEVAARIGLTAGIPVATPTGDQQAGFVGSVTDRRDCGHLNVGTGAQVAAYVESTAFVPPLEVRPFPIVGNLLTGAVLCGGWSYQVLEQFFRSVGSDVLGLSVEPRVYERLNELAAAVPAGADGLVCEPMFAGTRSDPNRRAAWRGMTAGNLTSGHMSRALLEGMAREYADQIDAIQVQSGRRLSRLAVTGNAMRRNPLLCDMVAATTGLPLLIPQHREEAAFGAALLAAVSVGRFKDLDEAASLIQYHESHA
jgi:sugar (pentulose or hexulose) kinase